MSDSEYRVVDDYCTENIVIPTNENEPFLSSYQIKVYSKDTSIYPENRDSIQIEELSFRLFLTSQRLLENCKNKNDRLNFIRTFYFFKVSICVQKANSISSLIIGIASSFLPTSGLEVLIVKNCLLLDLQAKFINKAWL
ncbi:hypothetical protein BpHYR1_053190 [Brachionus plicatilis]|uniref:Uncharacterized protein n=1 Tax=Brachionus plicatilis TaxID=10195 RepID=A0A3M7RC99_BRAPC|nr:hypothetical protein BpHYR1_053190 [Brachionus plicatilis]